MRVGVEVVVRVSLEDGDEEEAPPVASSRADYSLYAPRTAL